MISWATRIKLRMKELDMTQEELAQKMGLTRAAVTHYLAGRRVPPLRQFQKLAAILKVDPSWLQFGKEQESDKTYIKSSLPKQINQGKTPILTWDQISEFLNSRNIP